MTIQVCGDDIELDEGLRARAVRRVALSLGRFAGRVRRVTVSFSSAPAAGRSSTRCRVAAALGGQATIAVERDGHCAHDALEEAAEAAGRRLSRLLETERILGHVN